MSTLPDALTSRFEIAPQSVHELGAATVMIGRDAERTAVIVLAPTARMLPEGFAGDISELGDRVMLAGPLSAANAAALRKHFPWTRPVSLRKVRTSIGCGDRLGLASAGHIAAIREFQASPVLAQQSKRELNMTGRTFQNVVDDAVFLVFESDFRTGWGAAGDHLKTIEDIDVALDAGMPMITLDLSDVMNASAGDWDAAQVDAAFAALPAEYRTRIDAEYAGQTFVVGDCAVAFDAVTARRCAVMYHAAIEFAEKVSAHLAKRRGDEFDLEISIDETTSPTLPSHHLFIIRELRRRNVIVSSLAPRFIGEFQKAVDYIGDVAEFDRQFKVHAEIARANGNYKISVHSGSDKFAVYPSIGQNTRHYLHLKTAGTSWLVAVAMLAEKEPALYRKMHQAALENFDAMLKLYHITADLNRIPALDTLSDAELPALMTQPDARQLLHITYGPLLTGPLRGEFFAAMHKHHAAYTEAVRKHFLKHLSLLGVPRV